ncbi:MAG: type II toxin-antitoxin system HicB family antitoxin [Thermosynechococcaceae cyanobacterium MS004]|nr:type II toxin-antitoxin system HicB family antitoxin [Thermosynechococcaceae cyanobacterium MS004]
MVIQWLEKDELYLVHLPDFPWQQFVTHGKIYQEAAANGQEALEGLIAVLQDTQQPLPEPRSVKPAQAASNFSNGVGNKIVNAQNLAEAAKEIQDLIE